MQVTPAEEIPTGAVKPELVSAAYRRPIWTSIVVQFVLTLAITTILDGGFTGRMWAATLIAFWIGAVIIFLRRPHNPAASDLQYLKIAFIPLLFGAMLVGGAILVIRTK